MAMNSDCNCTGSCICMKCNPKRYKEVFVEVCLACDSVSAFHIVVGYEQYKCEDCGQLFPSKHKQQETTV